MERRTFLRNSLAGAGLVTGVGALSTRGEQGEAQAGKTPAAHLKICSQESRVSGKTFAEKIAKLDKWGAVGVELVGGSITARRTEIKAALKGTNVSVSVCCGGAGGVAISSDKAEREKVVSSYREFLPVAGDLGAAGVIFVPAFNRHDQLVGKEAREVLVEILGRVGEYAVKAGTCVVLEPLNRKEAYFLRQLADAASICRDVNSPGVAMMGDFYHMYFEETSDEGAFMSAGPYLKHVHLGSIKRKLPGQDARSFVSGFRGLKRIGYQGYVSLECGCIGDRDVETPKSFRFLEKQWAEATV
ncbi:MAG: sugar phosphate isomerase/epimerase family protein [Kiritimatiellia bacterium]|jgi:sugar phosphate isomerase/epimerase|nr:sugar phosphate isomerase/epimerase family protein [Kiritimatiellia bacterium]